MESRQALVDLDRELQRNLENFHNAPEVFLFHKIENIPPTRSIALAISNLIDAKILEAQAKFIILNNPNAGKL